MRPLLAACCATTLGLIALLISLCLWFANFRIHVATLALLTTSGPLISRVFEGLALRTQRAAGLPLDCVAAEDELLIARAAPLLMPIAGAAFSYATMG
jgi:hypothetical protein